MKVNNLYPAAIVAFSLLLCNLPVQASQRIKVSGEYQYTYGDSESLIEAKNLCYAMAVRNALESYKIFVANTSTIKDYRLLNDILKSISSGYLEDLQSIEEGVNGRTIHTKVEGYIVPGVVDKIINTEVQLAHDQEPKGLAENKYVKILRANESNSNSYLYFTFKTLNPNYPPYNFNFVINYYNSDGDPITGNKVDADSFLRGKTRGELGRFTVLKPFGTKYYRYWLTEINEESRQNAWLGILD